MKEYKELRKIMIDRDMNQAALADAIGMPMATMSRIMNGEREFKMSEGKAVVEALNIDPADIPAIFF